MYEISSLKHLNLNPKWAIVSKIFLSLLSLMCNKIKLNDFFLTGTIYTYWESRCIHFSN